MYQAGIANVFDTSYTPQLPPQRILQTDFHTAETFVRGVRATGVPASYAWCNKAGDITNQEWNYESFNDMPFFDKISNDWETR